MDLRLPQLIHHRFPIVSKDSDLVIHLGQEDVVISRRYETLSIINDVAIALWFIAGSIMFFWETWTIAGTWCFLIGSVQLLIRPGIRLTRRIHLVRRGQRQGPASHDF